MPESSGSSLPGSSDPEPLIEEGLAGEEARPGLKLVESAAEDDKPGPPKHPCTVRFLGGDETAPPDRLVEIVNNRLGRGFEFVSVNLKGRRKIEYSSSLEALIDGQLFELTPDHGLRPLVDEGIVVLPNRATPFVSAQQILDESAALIRRYTLSEDGWPEILSVFALYTWVFDSFPTAPYVRFLSEMSTGKTRFLEVLSQLCYRSIVLNGGSSEAAIFRTIDSWRGTLSLDEGDFSKSDASALIAKILNVGNSRTGGTILRCNQSRDHRPVPYFVFGPKVLAGKFRFGDESVESRCPLNFELKKRKLPDSFPRTLTSECDLWRRAREVRNWSLYFRLQNWGLLQIDEAPLHHLDPRVTQVVAPLLTVIPKGNSNLCDVVIEHVSQFSQERRSNMVVGRIAEVILSLWDEAEAQQEPRIVLQNIVERCNFSLDFETISPERLGRSVRGFGFNVRKLNFGRVIQRDHADSQKAIADLREEWGRHE